ncbi:putative flavin-binding monooxygenase [Xylogone sp. PMI_703]|nr:putative flavin-binding monooxygenase [Xylogone sp. PMI_703]
MSGSSAASPDDNHHVAPPTLDTDVIIIGAGISGINTAYRVKHEAPAGTSYIIFENRGQIGGTWDLFRYPGIRSDSDIYTFGFAWKPWTDKKPLAAGEKIRSYMNEAAREQGIMENIRFHHQVLAMDWSSDRSVWSVTVQNDNGETRVYHSHFVVLGTGYYNYETPLNAAIPGIESFKGDIIHPQFWPESLDYTDKTMVIIGSGATAVSIFPSVVEKVKRVTMLQRSPTYIVPLPSKNTWGQFFRSFLPLPLARRANRVAWILWGSYFYYFCHFFPNAVRKALQSASIKELPKSVSWDPHFKPRYNPWEQRLCVCPDGDFYAAIRTGKGEIITDTIKQVTEHEIQLDSGAVLKPDIIVTATGLKLRFGGDIKISIDGAPVDISSKFAWKGAMIQDVPNLIYVFGYLNASWTLGADVAAKLLTRLLRQLKKQNGRAATPRLQNSEELKDLPVMKFSSTYWKEATRIFPRSAKGQWKANWNYMVDMYGAKYGDVSTGLEVVRGN